jgi:hypothetical protein
MEIFKDRIVSIHRLSDIDGTRQGYITFTGTLESCIQPLGAEKTAMAGGSFGKMFIIFVDVDTNIIDGDKIKDKDGNWYQVVAGGVNNRNDGLIADYMSLTVKKINLK